MRKYLVLATLLAVAAPGLAQEPAAAAGPASGQTLRDAKGLRIGKITRVMADGSVQIIMNQHFVVVPANTLTSADNQVTTSLTKRELAKLR